MKASQSVIVGAALALAGMGLLSPASFAQSESAEVLADPLAGPTIPETFDENANFNNYFAEESIGGDAEFFFSIKQADRSISRSAKRIEALYSDVLHQQSSDDPILRTRDLPNPFSTSLFQLQAPASTSVFDNGF